MQLILAVVIEAGLRLMSYLHFGEFAVSLATLSIPVVFYFAILALGVSVDQVSGACEADRCRPGKCGCKSSAQAKGEISKDSMRDSLSARVAFSYNTQFMWLASALHLEKFLRCVFLLLLSSPYLRPVVSRESLGVSKDDGLRPLVRHLEWV